MLASLPDAYLLRWYYLRINVYMYMNKAIVDSKKKREQTGAIAIALLAISKIKRKREIKT